MRRLRPYQLEAFKYSMQTENPALFMEMRLGKTLVAIRRIKLYVPQDPKQGLKVLIIAPNSTLTSWEDELTLEGIGDPVHLAGKRADRLAKLVGPGNWFLINPEGCIPIKDNTASGVFCELLADHPWDVVLLDESTFIKNPNTKITKFLLNNFRDVPHRWILTGTPNPEGPLDFFSQFKFLNNDETFKGNYWQFRLSRFQCFGHTWVPKKGTEKRVNQMVSKDAFVLKRRDVKLDNPKVYQRRSLTMPDKLKESYENLKTTFIFQHKERIVSTKWAGSQFAWLRQISSGFLPRDEDSDPELIWDGKYQEVLNLLTGELKGEQVIIWFAFNHELFYMARFLEERLKLGVSDYGVITGKVPVNIRKELIRSFNKSRRRVMLMQVECGKFGMDLSAADTAIYFSSPLSGMSRMQSEDRILKVGEHSPLLYIDLVTKGTVDVHVLNLLRKKKTSMVTTLDIIQAMRKENRR